MNVERMSVRPKFNVNRLNVDETKAEYQNNIEDRVGSTKYRNRH